MKNLAPPLQHKMIKNDSAPFCITRRFCNDDNTNFLLLLLFLSL